MIQGKFAYPLNIEEFLIDKINKKQKKMNRTSDASYAQLILAHWCMVSYLDRLKMKAYDDFEKSLGEVYHDHIRNFEEGVVANGSCG